MIFEINFEGIKNYTFAKLNGGDKKNSKGNEPAWQPGNPFCFFD